MFILPRQTRFKSQTTPDTPNPTKVSHRGGHSRAELQAMGERFGWKATKELTRNDVEQMSAEELAFHEAYSAEALDRVLNADRIEASNRELEKQIDTRLEWELQDNENTQEFAKTQSAAREFTNRYVQFVKNAANAKAMKKWMLENNLSPTDVKSYVTAFEFLASEGALTLSPKAAQIGPEESLSGDALRTYSRLHLLLKSNPRLKPEDKLSADEWFAQHPELHDNRVPPLIAARRAKDAATAHHFNKTNTATAKATVVNVTDYPQEQTGVPPMPDKASFRMKVKSMSASEIVQRCNDDPQFKKALDELK